MAKLQIRTAEVFTPLLEPSRYKGVWGGRGCLHPDALIDTPNGQIKVSEFKGGLVYSWFNGRVVAANATAASEYTVEDLFEVVLADGRSIIATDQHKFLTARGWVELSDLSTSDAVVVSSMPAVLARPPTNWGNGLSASPQGVPHWTQTPEGYQGDCSEYLRQYGQQLLSEAGSDPAWPRQLADALQRSSRALSRLGDQVFGGIHSLSSALFHPSSRGALPSLEHICCAGLGSRNDERTFERLLASCLLPSRSLRKNARFGLDQVSCLLHPDPCILRSQGQIQEKLGGRLRRVRRGKTFANPFGRGDFKVAKVRLIRKHSRQAYWDLHVFGVNNYLSNGIVNHNSGKSHFIAELLIEDALRYPGDFGHGCRTACIREVQKSLKQSAKKLMEDKMAAFGLGEAQGFKVFREVIETPKDGLITFTGMQDHTADSVKSMEAMDRAWVEEAQSLSDRSMTLLRPTIRGDNSELLFSWNPMRPSDPVDRLLRGDSLPTGARVVRANWSDNPWFPRVLEQERLDCINNTPERYGHIWEGEYATVLDGAYYAKHLTEAQLSGRIGFFQRDDLLKVYAFWDIAGAGASADAVAIWIVQFIGAEVRVLDYYEAVGQDFATHVSWLRRNKYEEAVCILPHDGRNFDKVFAVTPRGFLSEAGFTVEVVENQGRGAAYLRVEAARRMFPNVRFVEDKTKGGREALGWYHEKRDENRMIGLGPNHDWSSHGSDAFGLIAVYKETRNTVGSGWDKPISRNLSVTA